MRKYKITNVNIEETYGGVYALSHEYMGQWNKKHIDAIEEKIAEKFGSGRKIWKEVSHLVVEKSLPTYFFIAWLEGDNREHLKNEYDEVYDGLHLFVAGYTEKIEDVIDTLYKIGDRRFQNEAVGFFY